MDELQCRATRVERRPLSLRVAKSAGTSSESHRTFEKANHSTGFIRVHPLHLRITADENMTFCLENTRSA